MVKCERASQKEARFLLGGKRNVSFFGFQNELEGKLSAGKQSHREVLTPLHSNKAILCRVSFFGFQNELEGKLSAGKQSHPRYFRKPLTY